MSQSTDGTFTTAVQTGAKQVSLPLQGGGGNNFATVVRRNYIVAPAAYQPIVGTTTAYTNRLKYSDDLTQAAVWTLAATTATAASQDIEGGSTASKLVEDGTNAAHTATQAMVVATGALAFGVLCKAAERGYVRLRIQNATDGNAGIAVFNLSTGVVVSGTGTIKKLLYGWYWCSVTGTGTVTNSNCIIDLTADGTTFSYTGSAGSGIYVFRNTCYLASAIGPAIATTSVTRAVTTLPVDADDPQAFLVEEQAPDTSGLEIGIGRFARTYANVPATTTVTKSMMVNLPSIPANVTYDLYKDGIIARLSGGLSYGSTQLCDFSSQISYDVFGPTIQTGTVLSSAPTSGTYTFTYKATTITLNYNDSTATITAAVNTMASIVADGITTSCLGGMVSGNFQIRATVGNWLQAPTADGTNLQPARLQILDVNASGSTDYLIRPRVGITVTAHGLSDNTKPLMTRTTTPQLNVVSSGNWFAYDANTITIKVTVGYLATLDAIAGFQMTYTPTAKPVQVNVVTRYSLSVITPDIYQGSGDAFLQAIFSGDTSINYQVGDSAHWPNEISPINSLTTIQVSAANL